MKKFFTFFVFLVVTVNAAAQYTGTYLDVSDPISGGFTTEPTSNGEKGVFDNDKGRLNVSGYIFYYAKNNQNQAWNWVDKTTSILYRKGKTYVDKWESDNFEGWEYFFGDNYQYPFTGANYNNGNNQNVTFYIKNCSEIHVFLERYQKVTSNEAVNTFSIEAFPSTTENPSNSNDFSSVAEQTWEKTLGKDEKIQFFPSLYDLDKNTIYKIKLTIPAYTYFYEISFVLKEYRKFETTIGNSNWATMYLDYPVRIPENAQSDLKVYTIVGKYDDNSVCLSDVNNFIPANTGVLLHETTPHEQITFIETGKPLDPIDTNWLTGTTTALNKDDNNYGLGDGNYALTLGYNQGNLGFFVYKGETIGANKAFIVTDFAQSVKGFYLSDFGEFTGIQTVENESTETGNWYSLQGVRLNARPTQRGIYLNNGKKVLVK